MDAHAFVYFLQGFAELTSKPPTPAQWTIIQTKLNSVFEKFTPDRTIVSPIKVDANGNLYKNVDNGFGPSGVEYIQISPAGESPLVQPTYCSSTAKFGFDPTQTARSC